MYVEQVRKQKNKTWFYVLGTLILVLAIALAGMPFEFALVKALNLEMQELASLTIYERLQTLPSNTTLFYTLFPFSVAFAVMLIVIKTLHHLPIKTLVTSRDKVDWGRVGFGFLVVIGVSAVLLALSYFANPESIAWNFDAKAFAILFAISIFMIPLQTTVEELFFRGYLMQGLGLTFSKRIFPFVLTSVFFGLLHYANPEVDKLGDAILISYVATGFFLGAITLMDEGLELAIGYHAGNNLFLSLVLSSDWTVFQTNALFRDVSDPVLSKYIVGPLVVYGLLFFIFARKYKWKNYKSHLITAPEIVQSH